MFEALALLKLQANSFADFPSLQALKHLKDLYID